jgi:hypothetical protein
VRGGEELDELEARFAAILASPKAARRAHRATLRANLSRRTRLRLWYTSRIDGIACWLCDHRRFGAAEMLWWITGGMR